MQVIPFRCRTHIDPSKLVRIEGELIVEIQELFKANDFYQGEINGEFDPGTKSALRSFYMIENFDERMRDDDLIDGEVLTYLRQLGGRA